MTPIDITNVFLRQSRERQQEILDYAKDIIVGAARGLYGIATGMGSPDDALYAASRPLVDALIIGAAHMAAGVPESNEISAMRHAMHRNQNIYNDAITRMNQRYEALAAVPEVWAQASGPRRAGMVAEGSTLLLAPGKILQGLNTLAARGRMWSETPNFTPSVLGNRQVEPLSFRLRTAEEVRAVNGRHPYIVDEHGSLFVTDPSVRLPGQGGNVFAIVDPADLAGGRRVLAAGHLYVDNHRVSVVDNGTLNRFFPASDRNFETIIQQALANHGFGEGGIGLIRPGHPGAVNVRRAAPANQNRFEGVSPINPNRPEGSAPVNGNRPERVAPTNLNRPEGTASFNPNQFRELDPQANLNRYDWRPVPAVAAMAALEVPILEAAIEVLPVPVRDTVAQTVKVTKTAAKVAGHEQEERGAPSAPPGPNPAHQAAADAAARHVQQVAQNVMNHNALFARRNPFFLSPAFPVPPPAPAPNPVLRYRFPVTQPSIRQTPSDFDIQMFVRTSLYPGMSLSHLEARASMYFGTPISTLTMRSAVDSTRGITRIGDYVCSNMSYSLSAYAHLLSATGLTSTYNGDHDVRFNALLHSLGVYGGVANKVGVIEGDIGDFSRLKILMPGGEMPFSPEELQRICKELEVGINQHESYPCFSLDFDTESAGTLYPLLHPCYQKTLTGWVIGILDAHLKGFRNGAIYPERFLAEWHRTGITNSAHLRPHIQDLKRLIPGYRSLHEILTEEGFDASDLLSKMTVSRRIIASQGPMFQEGDTLMIHPEFRVEYTMDLTPAYREEIESYRQQHGRYPEEYLKLIVLYNRNVESMIEQMQKLPEVAKYFRMLGVINFLCYAIRTLKLNGKKPVVTDVAPYPHFPKALPPLPMRYYQTHKVSLTPAMILAEIPQDVMNRFLYDYFWDGESQESEMIRQWIELALTTIVSRQIGSSDLDRTKIAKMTEKYFQMFAQSAMGGGETLVTPLMQKFNRIVEETYAGIGEQAPLLAKCLPYSFEKQENGRAKWEYLQICKKWAIEALNKKRDELRQQRRLPKFANAEQLFQDWEKDSVQVEAALHRRTDRFHPTFLQSPIQETWLQSRLDFEQSQQTRIVGGCHISLEPITPTPLSSQGRLQRLTQSLSTTGFTPVTWEGEQYHGFVLQTERAFAETGEQRQNYQDADLIADQGYTPLMIEAMRGDPASFARALATGNPDSRLVSGLDALRMLIFSGNEEGALLLLNSGKARELNHTTAGDVTALHTALEIGLPKVAVRLIEKGALFNLPRYKDGYTAVHLAAEKGQKEAITALCARGANLNQPLPNGKTALHLAAEAGLDPEFIVFLIEKGARTDLRDRAGNTALQCAIVAGQGLAARVLCERTPLWHLTNEAGETVSITAARYAMFDVLDRLLERGEDLLPISKTFMWSYDKAGRSVPYYMMRHGQVTFFRRYKNKLDFSKLILPPLEKNAAAHGHGLMVHVFVQGKNLEDSQKRHLLEKMIKVDDVHFVRDHSQQQNPSEHCRLAAEYGSRASAELLITHIRSARDMQPILIAAIKGGDPVLFNKYLEHLDGKKLFEMNTPLDAEGNRAVHYAVKYGRVEILKALHGFGAAMNVANSKGETLCKLAKQHEDKEILELLKKYGVEPQPEQEIQRALEGKEALDDLLTSAVPDADRKEIEAVARALRDSNFPEFSRIVRGKERHYFEGQPLLYFLLLLNPRTQADFAMRAMRHLAEHGYSPTMKSRAKEPAIFALLNGKDADEITAKLGWLRTCFPKSHETIVAQTNAKGQDLCDRASLKGRPSVLKAMSQQTHSKKAFHYACMGGEIETLRELIKAAGGPSAGELLDEKGNAPLHIAALLGHVDIVEELLAWGVNPRLKNRLGDTALHVAIMTKNIEAAHRVLDYMGDYMAYGNLANREGETPLMLAVMHDLTPLITRLIPLSNLYAVDKEGSNALHLAAATGALKAIRQLRAWEMDLHVGDSAGTKHSETGATPLHYAAENGQLEAFRLLLEMGAELNRVSTSGKSVAESMVLSNAEVMYHEMIRLGLFTQNHTQQRLVHAAAKTGNIKALEYLYVMGVRLDEYDEHGVAPLHAAVVNNHPAIVDFLLTHGCHVTQPAADGVKTTAFALAKNSSMRKLLVSYIGKQEIPDFPPPVPFAPTEDHSLQSNPPNDLRNTHGLTREECELVGRFLGLPDDLAMASRIKKEFGIGQFYQLFTKLQSCSRLETIEIMQKLLTLADEKKRVPAGGALDKLLKDVWNLPLEQMRQQIRGPWEGLMRKKSAGRTPDQMKEIFAQAKNPLSPEALSRVAANYASVLRHHAKMIGASQTQLLAAASSQDPMEAVAAIRETVFRKFGHYPYDTQLFAMLALIERPQGRLGQMQTGEGKSLVFAMMAAFYATRKKTVGVITTTQSLAKRDQKKFAEFYRALGVSSSHLAVKDPDESHFSGQIIYGTNTDFEFPLLRGKIKGPPQVCLIDEVDSLFLDQGLNAARIAAPAPEDHSWVYSPYLDWIRNHEQFDLAAVREMLGRVDGQATRSLTDETLEALFHKGKEALEMREKTHYTVRRGKIVIVDDENTGARQEGCRWPGGLHEFLEAKHNLHVERNSVTLSSISHVAFFKMCEILVGLTGTLGGEEERSELETLYGTELFDIPPRFPSERVYLSWKLCDDEQSYYAAVQNRVQEMQAAGRPTLILLQTIEDCEKMGKALSHSDIPCQLFTAVQQEKEEVLVKRAVAPGTVTVATSAAGRGTDFMLSPESIRAGGMHAIVGFLPHNQRVENQGTGRTRRQGQPGSYEVLIPPNTAFVNELVLLGLLKGSLPPESMKDKRIWLLRLRALRVKMLSEKRKTQSESSLVHYSLFQDFSSMQKIVEGRLKGQQKAECKEKLTHLWAEFSLETEHQSLSADRFREKYERFLETRVFPLPWFEGLLFSRQYVDAVEEGKR